MQGGSKNVIETEEKISAFHRKLKLWGQQLANNNFANFPLLDKVVSRSDTTINHEVSDNELQRLMPVFTEHLQKLQRSFENYFPDQMQYPAWIPQPFAYDTTTAGLNSPYIDDIIIIFF